MNDIGVIDTFFDTFNRMIDGGFGLLGGDVASLSNRLVAIDVTLAALMWTLAAGEDVLARLIRKVLYVGFFAFLIGNFQALATIVFKSFTALGLTATGAGLPADEMLRPGKLAALGVSTGKPLLEAAADLSGWPGVFENLVQILVLLVAFLLILIAFFVMAVQVFVVLIEFKLATLIGFVLVPFGLFGRTAFLAEKVLGEVLAMGVKVMALAVVVGIGSTLFDQFSATWVDGQPTLEQVLALVLASLVLVGLSIFCPSLAAGLISGAPQLGAGAAVGTGLAVGGAAMAGAAGAQMAAGQGAALSRGVAAGFGGAAGGGGKPPRGGMNKLDDGDGPTGSPKSPGGPDTPGPRGPSSPNPGPSGAGPSAPPSGSGGGANETGQGPSPAATAPDWARDLQRRQALAHGAGLAAHSLASGDAAASGGAPSLSET
ncbi:P-type conjugative transfer protein TrbL [Caulobacter sp. UNC279MFTsu5.1]|uniref:P-type conjugative transfer protein TrbL n=1 Tax=Caulobacter sp. UNC279MFTsu5.1 TaxID=1502775 RepID=UPI0008E1C8ED|nr:P-type conjugative transfer protein TrbL [Caulobacter sp. UNC279MFTsu5.1]SFI53375.1 type IV secretion system protein TrbL [Caulobacter sp. UNC279MFTsu5.1]